MGAFNSVRNPLAGSSSHRSLIVQENDLSATFESKILLTSLKVHFDEITRIATAASESLANLAVGDNFDDVLSAEVRRLVPRWHFPMLNDNERIDAFAAALEKQIQPGSRVLDIGSGTGLLAMMAIRAGAASVVTCETNPVMAEIAKEIIAQHGMSDVITVVPKLSTDLVIGRDLDAPVDFLISEIVDCGLIGEGLLPTIAHAREHLLAPGGEMLPRSARLLGFLVDSPVIAGLNRAGTAGGFDVRRINALSTRGHFPVRLSTWPHRVVSETAELTSFDLASGPLGDGEVTVSLPITSTGTPHALVAWFEMDLGAGVVVRNSPDNVGSHWMQALVPFGEPLTVFEGGAAAVTLSWRDGRLSVSAHPDSPTSEN